ncbi:polynucleotide kinase-phosphatase [Asanoa ishikariensis]|uniref:Polynucleotide 3'-phosphatase /polynucleotide 5'-hydroxyl-kinase /polynucleotide 2',3'-cyclic phosphate phosphodiesterase n=1 Tax=Asanoa ishikariensis TaxID=137265 RepID=A0A1H3UAD8_9ACTN|nr:polynucleotide kinase-phosphatase [Asanoa ishikariensis]GIF63981.1 polynucleotide kinase-phosphatase [Asanoa ishikariensis]SDZ59358.1 polynucleotide 3'-phosphatase /polynucleotide 5'-hydroxyl-kinase /polynucleotide 2',3'-cyclic phosphate phosphodiesterase [Asanoa ishikariensis]
MTELPVPALSLVALIGISGAGKSTFARRHFLPSQVLSSDAFRAMVADDETDQSASAAAFDALHYVAGKRLAAGRLTVIDATHVQEHARSTLVALARAHDVLPVAIVLDLPEEECWSRTEQRPDRSFGRGVLARQSRDLRRTLKRLNREGFRTVHVLRGRDEIEAATIRLQPLYTDRRELAGPFDVIGDVHGCRSELETLLTRLGWTISRDDAGRPVNAEHPEGRTAVFVGDLVDRGPDSPGVLRLVMGMVRSGTALCVNGNHEAKLLRKLRGKQVTVSHGLAETLEQLDGEDGGFVADATAFIDGLVSHYILDGGRLAVAHAGIKEEYQGRASGRVRAFCLYGDTTGETDEYGLPVRYPWADDYRGPATVVYGHTTTVDPQWVNNTICVDTGCVFGGELTALRYPERTLVSVPAEREHYAPATPLATTVPERPGDLLDVADVLPGSGRRQLDTPYGRIPIEAPQAAAALEILGRFAIDPRWLIYLPPTMAPAPTSKADGYLEHPREAFDGYREAGVTRVICEEKHMGSRALVLVCRDEAAAARRFGVTDGETGAIYTRTGRPFFTPPLTADLLARVRAAVSAADLWAALETDWLLLDTEILPWSAKAGELIRGQYASVGAAAGAALPATLDVLATAINRGLDVTALRDRTRDRATNAALFTAAYQRYVRPTTDLTGVTIAPFAVLAAEGTNLATNDNGWHLSIADRLVAADSTLFTRTARVPVDLDDPATTEAAEKWWSELTDAGGEGMVVKPADGLVRTARGGLAQPGLKCRGREYLRIIYGPDYTTPDTLAGLRGRNLGRKRSLALREHSLGLAALDRHAAGEPLWRVHELVFGILALESEPVDPRL